MTPPFAPGSVSVRLYPHNDLPATAIVDELFGHAALAAESGFDGVMTSEHHGGFHGYLPNPLQVTGWQLEAMASGWAAPCPLLLPLRPAAMVAEEVAWLDARFPGRVGVGVAAGSLPADFEVMGVPMDDLTARFTAGIEQLSGYLRGTDQGILAGDPALKRCVDRPLPFLSAAMSLTAARRAARVGAGLIFESLSATDRVRQISDAYRAAGGDQPCVMVRRAWLGPPPRDLVERQLAVYRTYSQESKMSHWQGDQLVGATDPEVIAEGLAAALDAAGVDALNIRVHVPGVSPRAAREQIAVLGEHVLPLLRKRLT
jgi:alkanesulfonate monooxygenase SsuD/methylene tetrahydromethanopterin reductase-like flavin-dependent oxidoreductase (luciferase family)